MLSRIGFFALTLLSFPLSVSAAVVNIEYSAHITSTLGDGVGYQAGDLINGTYVVDTSKAEGKNVDTATEVMYYGSDSSGLLQSNFAASPAGYFDFVTVQNNDSIMNDQLALTKVLAVQNNILEMVGIGFYFLNVDWISNLSLDNINLSVSDAADMAYSNGAFARFNMFDWSITDSATFWLDSVKITSTSVPEPASTLLLALGALGLAARRKLR